MTWERVYTFNDWYDGPRLGVADVDGVPHIYKSLWMETDTEDVFVVAPISEELLKLVLEDWRLWTRFHSPHERLSPEDRKRLEQLAPIVERGLRMEDTPARRLKASFRGFSVSGDSIEVEWREESE